MDHRYLPKKLTSWGSDKTYDIPYSVGLISSKKSFGYGFYEFEVKLPQSGGLWPAVWLSCDESWPPEIDINESYSDENGNYGKKLQSNFHFNFNEDKQMAGARNHKTKTDKKIKMSLWWTKDFIKIYYNGYLVRIVTTDYIMKWFRDVNMIVILNNAIRPEYVDIQGINENEVISKFEIYYFRYWN